MFRRRTTLRSSKLARKRRRQMFLRLTFVFLVLVLLVGGAVYGLHREEITIKTVHVEGNLTLSDEDIKNFILEEISGTYLYLIPRSNIFFYPRRALETDLLAHFARIESVEVGFEDFDAIRVRIAEREPQSLWCGENRLADTIPACYFVDEGGVIYARAPAFSGDVYFRFFDPIEAGDPLGQSFLSGERFQALLLFLRSLEEKGFEGIELAERDEQDYELYLNDGTLILFPQDGDLAMLLDNLESVLVSDEFRNRDTLSLEYIDLRFGNKVFYKYRE